MGKRYYSDEQIEKVRKMRSEGCTYKEIKKEIGAAIRLLQKWCKDVELTDEQKFKIRSRTGAHKGSPRKIKEIEEARRLRKEEGLSVGVIANKLNVAKSSVSVWVRDIELTNEQILFLTENVRSGSMGAAERKSELFLRRRMFYQDKGRNKIKNGASELYKIGCMLYWAEGAKRNNKSSVNFCNSDLFMMKIFLKFLLEEFDLKKDNIKIYIRVYLNNGLTLEDVEQYWIDGLGLKKENLNKTVIHGKSEWAVGKPRGKKVGYLKYGVCNVQVSRTDFIQEIYGAIQEYGGFEKSEWLG